MPGEAAITVDGLSKRYGAQAAVDDLSFEVALGRASPASSAPTARARRPRCGWSSGWRGRARAGADLRQALRELDDPAHTVGSSLEVSGFHPGRSGRDHLRSLAVMARLPASRVDEVLDIVELRSAAGRRAGKYSMGMRQRLALAATLLGDPQVLVLDEPANGLDPQGIRWLRDFLRAKAAEGRTVLVSSHVLSEVAQTVDDVVVISRGRLIYQGSIGDFTRRAGGDLTRVRVADAGRLRPALEAAGATLREGDGAGVLLVSELDATAIGEIALREGVALRELTAHGASLEDVFLELTADPAEAVQP